MAQQLDAQERELIDLMSEMDAEDRNWMLAFVRTLGLFEPDDRRWAMNAMLRHRRAELRRKLIALDDFSV